MSDSIRPHLLLTDGRRVDLPAPVHAMEFVLPGNSRQFEHLLAFFDPVSETGAIFYNSTRAWHLHQPASRDEFFLQCAMLDALMPSTQASSIAAVGAEGSR